MEDYVGLIKMFSGNTIPYGWLACQGQVLSTTNSLYSELFDLIGYKYNAALTGTGNFQLPDLRGRVAVGSGMAASGTDYAIGQTGGTEEGVVGLPNMPSHSHQVTGAVNLMASASPGNVNSPAGAYYAVNNMFNEESDGSGCFAEDFTIAIPSTSTGTSVPYNNMQPYVTVNYMICYLGIFPSAEGSNEEETVGMVLPFAGTIVPGGYLLCDGKTYSVRDYAALGNLLGADSAGNFTVPNLIGRAAMGTTAPSVPGQPTGSETIVLTVGNINNHTHSVTPDLRISCYPPPGNTPDPTDAYPALMTNGYSNTGEVQMGDFVYNLTAATAGAASPTGIENRSPFIAMQYIICAQGIYPFPNN